ncbi:MAG: CvpA family protein [Gammaproteobacteria bacterium]
MNWADYVILAIIAFSALISLIRGFVREAFSLATWIGAFAVGVIFVEPAARLLAPYVPGEQLRLVLAFAGLFAITLIVGIALSHFAAMMVQRAKLTRADRGFGLFFGIVRGYVAVSALVVAASFTHLPQSGWWQRSLLIPFTHPLASWIAHNLPTSQLKKGA